MPISKIISDLSISSKASVIFFAIQKENSSSACNFYAYKKENNNWNLLFHTEGYLGRSGVINPDERTEGSGTTPSGIYSFGMLFGICDEPSNLKKKYKKIDIDDYWDGDCNSETYNQYVKASQMPESWNAAASEHLIDFGEPYSYVAMINFNVDPVVKGRGSAIFFHCTREGCTGSAGCVCIPKDFMLQALRMIDEDTYIIISQNIDHIKNF